MRFPAAVDGVLDLRLRPLDRSGGHVRFATGEDEGGTGDGEA